MNLTGHIWEGDDDGALVKVDITVERTDADEVAIFARGEDNAETTVYLSVNMASRVAAMLGIAAFAHEIQAHEAAKIAASGAPEEGK